MYRTELPEKAKKLLDEFCEKLSENQSARLKVYAGRYFLYVGGDHVASYLAESGKVPYTNTDLEDETAKNRDLTRRMRGRMLEVAKNVGNKQAEVFMDAFDSALVDFFRSM